MGNFDHKCGGGKRSTLITQISVFTAQMNEGGQLVTNNFTAVGREEQGKNSNEIG